MVKNVQVCERPDVAIVTNFKLDSEKHLPIETLTKQS